MSTVKEIYDQAITLSASERASLAHDLILSLDETSDYELSPVQEGTAKGRSADEVFAGIKAKYS